MTQAAAGDRPVPLVFCFDAGYAAYAAVAITSALANADGFYRIYCLYSGAPETFPAEIRTVCARHRCELAVVQVPQESFAEWRVDAGTHFSPAAYYRLLIPELVPEDRLIYLDCDLVVTCGLAGLFGQELGESWIAGCLDPKGRATSQMKLPDAEPYLNTGVLLMDVAALRRERPMPVIREYYQAHEACVTWVDQCLINKFCEGRKLVLADRWNVQFNNIDPAAVERVLAEEEGRAVLHFSGQVKAWMEWAPSRLIALWSHYAHLAGLRPRELIQKPASVRHMSQLAAKHELEGDWKAAAGAWKALAIAMEGRVRALSQAARG